MPRYIPFMPFEDCFGSVGDLTFFHRDGQCFYKTRQKPAFPGTLSQMEQQSVHLRALDAWRQLDHATQMKWNRCAVGVVSHRPPFDGKSGISGYNLFVSAYHGFAALEDEHVPKSLPWENFPPYGVEGVKSVGVEDGALLLKLSVFIDPSVEAGRYQMLARLQLAKQGGGRDAGKMRSFLAEAPLAAGHTSALFRLQDYVGVWNLDLPAYTVHLRHVLLDRRSGYRSQYIQQSFDVTLP